MSLEISRGQPYIKIPQNKYEKVKILDLKNYMQREKSKT